MTINNTVIAIIAGFLCSVILGVTAWNFTTVVDIPKVYATKYSVECEIKDIERRQERIEDKLDRIIEYIMSQPHPEPTSTNIVRKSIDNNVLKD